MKHFRNLKRPRLRLQGIWASTPPDSVPFSSTRTIVRACLVRPDTPPTARHGESWNVMPAV